VRKRDDLRELLLDLKRPGFMITPDLAIAVGARLASGSYLAKSSRQCSGNAKYTRPRTSCTSSLGAPAAEGQARVAGNFIAATRKDTNRAESNDPLERILSNRTPLTIVVKLIELT
jgi:hypothetical protein